MTRIAGLTLDGGLGYSNGECGLVRGSGTDATNGTIGVARGFRNRDDYRLPMLISDGLSDTRL